MPPQEPGFPNDPLGIFFPNGSVQGAQMFIWDAINLKPILWTGTITATIGALSGTLTNNNAAPSNNNIGVLPAVANASAPTLSEGKQVLLSTDLAGNLRTTASISLSNYALETGGNLAAIKSDLDEIATDTDNLAGIKTGTDNLSEIATDTDNLAGIKTDTDILVTAITPYSYISAGSSNQDSQVAKNAPCKLCYVSVFSTVASLRYVKIYDKSTGPTSSDTPIMRVAIPNNTTGAGSNLSIPMIGINLANGLSFRITTGAADNDTGAASANDVFVNLGFHT